MNETAVAPTNGTAMLATELLERTLITGDISKLSAAERLTYYRAVCDSVGLNPLTRPFDYLTLNGKTVLYAKRDATDQLRKLHHVSVRITARERMDEVYVVTAQATMPDGRTDESIGAVSIGGLKGEALANGLMKAETKSKRRVTLSICGLGMLDETEVESIPGARVEPLDVRLPAAPVPQLPAAPVARIHKGECQRCHADSEITDARVCADEAGCRARCSAIKRPPMTPEGQPVALDDDLSAELDAHLAAHSPVQPKRFTGTVSEKAAAFERLCDVELSLDRAAIQRALGGKVQDYMRATARDFDGVYAVLDALVHDGAAVPGKLGVEMTA